MDEKIVKKMFELYRDNQSLRQIAARFGVSQTTVHENIRTMPGYRPRNRWPGMSTSELLAMRKSGMSYREIAKQTGMSLSGVYYRLNGHTEEDNG